MQLKAKLMKFFNHAFTSATNPDIAEPHMATTILLALWYTDGGQH